jgi:hypothetical protein
VSHIDSVSPPSATLTPGQSVNLNVAVSGVPGDETVTVTVTASDGSAGSAQVVIDRANLEALVGGTATLQPHQIRAVLTGSGTLVKVTDSPAVYRYTAA